MLDKLRGGGSVGKPLKNEPFIKNLFCDNYIYSYLAFPEFTTNKELDELHNLHVDPVRNYLSTTSREKIQSGTNFTREAVQAFNQLGLFVHSIPRSHNGAELDSTSVARVIEECALNGYANLAMHLIYSNEIGTKAIVQYGNSKQHEKYLGRLVEGRLRAGFGFSELNTGIDASRFSLTAVQTSSSSPASSSSSSSTSSDTSFTLNGQKCWVSLLTDSSSTRLGDDFVLVVVAKTIQSNEEVSLTAFVVDANTPGKTITEYKKN